ncbi:MAG TPA: DUF5690 family protein [Kiritimatiellia bacterium]|nr:DUF5690 family protein [Kiritimatiellia bacterium]HPS07124.1 DUF5690 family protein [Kiritimatiellia bacterium]
MTCHEQSAQPAGPLASPRRPLSGWLETVPSAVFVLYAGIAGFVTYFSMYAFRKPFLATVYEGPEMAGLDAKAVFVISQVAGYTLSKYIGIKVCSETRRRYRLPLLLGLALAAETAWLLFAVLPPALKPVAVFANGLPLGMVWGICVLYLEGRRATEILIAGLSSSYIISSGVFKDIGRVFLHSGLVGEYWMPFVTGLCFLPLFAVAAWMLDQLPPPTKEDEAQRAHREPMRVIERHRFIHCFARGIVLQLILFIALTAFRDFRDCFGLEIFQGLGLDGVPGIFSRTEVWVALMAMAALSSLKFFDAKKWGVAPNMVCMAVGALFIGGSTLLFDVGAVTGSTWMIWVGMGSYLAYVANDTIFYDRVLAGSRWTGTAVFMTYVMDAGGQTGSIALQLYKGLESGNVSYLGFFHHMTYLLSALIVLILAHNTTYFSPRRLAARAAAYRQSL